MTDPLFVVAAYATVVGCLAIYVGSVARRLREARSTLAALEQARKRPRQQAPTDAAGTTATPSGEPLR